VQTVTLELPDDVYKRLRHIAKATGQPMKRMLLKVFEAGLPPGVEDVPLEYREDIAKLELISDDELWRIARRDLSPAKQHRYSRLLNKNSRGTLTEREHAELNELRKEADCLMLCRAQAYALLRWRGYKIPVLAELKKSR
jgi:predicted DNA-binding protein